MDRIMRSVKNSITISLDTVSGKLYGFLFFNFIFAFSAEGGG